MKALRWIAIIVAAFLFLRFLFELSIVSKVNWTWKPLLCLTPHSTFFAPIAAVALLLYASHLFDRLPAVRRSWGLAGMVFLFAPVIRGWFYVEKAPMFFSDLVEIYTGIVLFIAVTIVCVAAVTDYQSR